MFKHFKRRWTAIGNMVSIIYSKVNWWNFIFTIPIATFFSIFVVLIMQLEDYDDVDYWDSQMDKRYIEPLNEMINRKKS